MKIFKGMDKSVEQLKEKSQKIKDAILQFQKSIRMLSELAHFDALSDKEKFEKTKTEDPFFFITYGYITQLITELVNSGSVKKLPFACDILNETNDVFFEELSKMKTSKEISAHWKSIAEKMKKYDVNAKKNEKTESKVVENEKTKTEVVENTKKSEKEDEKCEKKVETPPPTQAHGSGEEKENGQN